MTYDTRIRNKPPGLESENRPFGMSPGHASGRLCSKCNRPTFDARGSCMAMVRGARQWVGRCCNPKT